MKSFLAGVGLGAALGAGAFYVTQAFVLSPPSDCAGLCAEGTSCEQGSCRALAPAPAAEAAPEPAPAETKRKRRRKRRAKGEDASAGAPMPSSGPPRDDDSGVPRFDPNKDQEIGLADGSARLRDAEVERELAKLDKPLQTCVREANERVPELGSGRVKYSFGVAGSGKVTGVNASGPANLVEAGVVACVRKVVYAHRFPIFNGPELKVSSSFLVD